MNDVHIRLPNTLQHHSSVLRQCKALDDQKKNQATVCSAKGMSPQGGEIRDTTQRAKGVMATEGPETRKET